MLHVTNGDSAAAVIQATGLGGDVLPWRDVLHEGPVPEMSADGLRSVRAGFLAGPEWTTYEEALRELTDRDARLARAAAREEIVLWFEHDLYDQLQLLQILNQLSDERADWRRVSLVCDAEYVGPSSPDRLRERFPGRVDVTEATVDLARRAWGAFRAADPRGLVVLLRGDLSALPFFGPALRRHLEQFPSIFNGLSRSEQQALAAIAAGAGRIGEAFRAHQEREDPIFLGDLVFVTYIRDLSHGEAPLVTVQGGPNPLDEEVSLTAAGESVLRGEADRIVLNGIDRWLGGVHLDGRDVWRWDGKTAIQPNM